MLCPKCGKEMDQDNLCPWCAESQESVVEETSVTQETPVVEQTPAVEEIPAAEEVPAAEECADLPEGSETEEIAEAEEVSEAEETANTAETSGQEETEAPKKKKSCMAVVAGVIIALLVVVVVCLGFALKYVSDNGSLPSLSELKAAREEKKFDADAIGVAVTDETGSTVAELSNSFLSFYYWGEYYYFVQNYGFAFDSTLPLEQQVYETVEDSATGTSTVTTWHQYFLESACYSINQIESMKAEAMAQGFEMSEAYKTEYDSILANMASNAATAGFVDEAGNGDALAYIRDSYGPNVTLEQFEQYLYDSYYVSSYSEYLYNSPVYEDSELEAYFDENADYFLSYGVEKSDVPNVNVRHILIEPEYAEDGTVSDEAWEAAEKQAQELLARWQEGEATEESFAALANENSTDPGSNTVGGLYEDVYPGQMVPAFNDWCFDESRQTGDTAVVKTDYGYHIMYFVAHTDNYYWMQVADSDMRYYESNTMIQDMALKYTTAVQDTVDVVTPDAVKTIMESGTAAG